MRTASALFYRSLGFVVAAIIAVGGAILGWHQEVAAQLIIFYAAATFALVIWGWHQLFADWMVRPAISRADGATALVVAAAPTAAQPDNSSGYLAELVRSNRAVVILLLLVAVAFGIASFAIDGFFTLANAAMVVAVLLYAAAAYALSRVVRIEKSAFIGISVLLGLFVVGALAVDPFDHDVSLESLDTGRPG